MKATLCDICNIRIDADALGPGKASYSGPGNALTQMDLCSKHFSQFKAVVKKWASETRKTEGGFMP